MKKVIIIAGNIDDDKSANNICLNNILREMNGCEIHVIGDGCDDSQRLKDGVYYHAIKAEKNNLMLHRISAMINFYRLPDSEPHRTLVRTNKAISLINKLGGVDAVIGINNPFYSIAALVRLKKCFPEIKYIALYFDLLTNLSSLTGGIRLLRDIMSQKGELKAFEAIDYILLPIAAQESYSQQYYQDIQDKIVYYEFPNLIEYDSDRNHAGMESETVDFVYAGTLDKNYRDPQPLFDILNNVSSIIERKIMIDFYGKNIDTTLERCQIERSLVIHNKGLISHDQVLDKMAAADFIVTISNSFSNIVPSKIFEQFASCKPLVIIVSNPQDYALKYYEKYPLGFIIRTYEKTDYSRQLADFIIQNYGKRIEFSDVKKIYRENSPEFVANQIYELIYN